MRRNFGNRNRNSGFYRVDALLKCLEMSEFNSPYALAKHLDLNTDTTYRVFQGTASYKQVWPIAKFFKIDWKLLHDLNLSTNEIHRAVLNADSSSAR